VVISNQSVPHFSSASKSINSTGVTNRRLTGVTTPGIDQACAPARSADSPCPLPSRPLRNFSILPAEGPNEVVISNQSVPHFSSASKSINSTGVTNRRLTGVTTPGIDQACAPARSADSPCPLPSRPLRNFSILPAEGPNEVVISNQSVPHFSSASKSINSTGVTNRRLTGVTTPGIDQACAPARSADSPCPLPSRPLRNFSILPAEGPNEVVISNQSAPHISSASKSITPPSASSISRMISPKSAKDNEMNVGTLVPGAVSTGKIGSLAKVVNDTDEPHPDPPSDAVCMTLPLSRRNANSSQVTVGGVPVGAMEVLEGDVSRKINSNKSLATTSDISMTLPSSRRNDKSSQIIVGAVPVGAMKVLEGDVSSKINSNESLATVSAISMTLPSSRRNATSSQIAVGAMPVGAIEAIEGDISQKIKQENSNHKDRNEALPKSGNSSNENSDTVPFTASYFLQDDTSPKNLNQGPNGSFQSGTNNLPSKSGGMSSWNGIAVNPPGSFDDFDVVNGEAQVPELNTRDMENQNVALIENLESNTSAYPFPMRTYSLRNNGPLNAAVMPREVFEETQAEIERKERVADEHRSATFYKCVIFGMALLAIAAIVGITVGVLSRRDPASNPPPTMPTEVTASPAPSFSLDFCETNQELGLQSDRYQAIRDIVSQGDDKLLRSIDSANSDQRKALCWLAYFDAMKLSADPDDTVALIQRYSVAVIYYSLVDGTSSTLNLKLQSGWLGKDHECSWKMISCVTGDNTTVNFLDANDENGDGYPLFIGSIPAEIAGLTNLIGINWGHQGLTGSIPSSLYTISSLEHIILNNNGLTGSIPNAIAASTKIQDFQLDSNKLTGSLPNGFFASLPYTRNIYLGNNSLTGTLDTSIGLLRELGILQFENNQITGFLPSEIGLCSNLGLILLGNNSLNGTIPTEFGSLIDLIELSVNNNQLTGVIPSELGQFINASTLLFDSNKLTGTMPGEICNLRSPANLLVNLTVTCQDVNCSCCTTCGPGLS